MCMGMCLNLKRRYMKWLLRNSNLDNTEKFSFDEIEWAKVIKVYDGDTITIAAKYNKKLYQFVVRLHGIDTPEIRTKNKKEKYLGIEARDVLKEKIFDKIIRLENIQNEKYGRILADIYIVENDEIHGEREIHINKWMIDNKYADPYDGGTKKRSFV